MKTLTELCNALRDRQPVLLATIIGTSGSTPAPADSRMIVHCNAGARAVGTIGGGCLDASVIEIARGADANYAANIMTFQLDDDTGDTGLNCGGSVTAFLEPVNPDHLAVYEAVRSALLGGKDCFLLTAVSPTGGTQKIVYDSLGLIMKGDAISNEIADGLPAHIEVCRSSGRAVRFSREGNEYLLEMFHAKPRVIIFGGGHVGKSVSQCAALAGFHVTVVDDRLAFANKERFPEADIVLCEPFSQTMDWMEVPSTASIVIVTRGHKHDETALEKALGFDCTYVGMIGSRRKVEAIRANLILRGADPERLARVHAPIGLDIGAITPDEIAVSIVAELIAVKRKKEGGAFQSLSSSL